MYVVTRFVLFGWRHMFVGNLTGRGARKIRNGELHHPSYNFICKCFLIIISAVVFSHNFMECDSAHALKMSLTNRAGFFLTYNKNQQDALFTFNLFQ